MKKINKTLDLPIQLTPEEVADLWCSMMCFEQARFFNEISRISKTWDCPLEFQLASVEMRKELTEEGRNVMKIIGQYT